MKRSPLPAASMIFLLALVVPGCAGAKPTTATLVVNSAKWHLETKPRLKQDDCSGLTCAILKRAGIAAPGDTRALWKDAVREKRITEKPAPGDLVFFARGRDQRHRRRRADRGASQ